MKTPKPQTFPTWAVVDKIVIGRGSVWYAGIA